MSPAAAEGDKEGMHKRVLADGPRPRVPAFHGALKGRLPSSARPAPFFAKSVRNMDARTPARQHASTPARQRPSLALKLADVMVIKLTCL